KSAGAGAKSESRADGFLVRVGTAGLCSGKLRESFARGIREILPKPSAGQPTGRVGLPAGRQYSRPRIFGEALGRSQVSVWSNRAPARVLGWLCTPPSHN